MLFILLQIVPVTVPAARAAEPARPAIKAGEERSFSSLEMRFCWCPPGTFAMGSPADETGHYPREAQAKVTLTRGFWLGKYEVAQEEFVRVMGKNPSAFRGDRRPVETVSWEDAEAFCRKLIAMERSAGRLPEGWTYRLPTEAQWEYACRARSPAAYCFGADTERLSDFGWYDENSKSQTHDVGEKKPNAWGLHDMHGNVWEMCRDAYVKELPGGKDPQAATGGTKRVPRGGGWSDLASHCRSAHRWWSLQSAGGGSALGFRVAIVSSDRVPENK